MKYEFDSVAVGNRIRQARNARGWSQEMLAEKADTSSQNISKFEKNGLSDMVWISRLSFILDANLLDDAINIEGTVGEIGKEILIILAREHGHKLVEDFKREMFGLSDHQITNEIVKLSQIGMVEREKYKDWCGDEIDMLFITAKGVITLKNLDLNRESSAIVFDNIQEIYTYEELVGEYGSYSEYICANAGEKKIRQIKYIESDSPETFVVDTVYRENLIRYLKKNQESSFDYEEFYEEEVPLGVNIFHDIILRMILNIDMKALSDIELGIYEDNEKLSDLRGMLCELGLREEDDMKYDYLSENLIHIFDDEFDYKEDKEVKEDKEDKDKYISEVISKHFDELSVDKFPESWTQEKIEKYHELLGYSNEYTHRIIGYPLLREEYIDFRNRHKDVTPDRWFSFEEIEDFINSNMYAAKTDKEKRIDDMILSIMRACPDALEYFEVPQSWKDAGILDLIWKNYRLDEVYTRDGKLLPY